MTQSVEHLFEFDWKSWIFFALDSKNWTFFFNFFIWLKELSLFLYESKIEKFFLKKKKSHPKKWLKELNPFLFVSTMTQRIELFVNDSLNWASFMNFFSIRVEFFFFWFKELNFFFFEYDSMNRSYFFECDSKIEIFGWKSQKWIFSIFWKLKIDSFHMTRRIEPAFSTWLRELNYFWNWLKVFFNGLEESNPFFQYDSTNRTFLKCDSFFKMIQRTEPLFGGITQRIGLDSKTWTLCFSNLIPRIGLILMTPRLEASFLNYVTKNFFWKKKNDSKNWTEIFDSKICFFVWLKELIFLYDPKNWNLFLWIWHRELNPFSFLPQRIETFSSLPQMIEFFFFKNFIDSKNWTFFFSDMTQRNEIRKKKKTQRVELFF